MLTSVHLPKTIFNSTDTAIMFEILYPNNFARWSEFNVTIKNKEEVIVTQLHGGSSSILLDDIYQKVPNGGVLIFKVEEANFEQLIFLKPMKTVNVLIDTDKSMH